MSAGMTEAAAAQSSPEGAAAHPPPPESDELCGAADAHSADSGTQPLPRAYWDASLHSPADAERLTDLEPPPAAIDSSRPNKRLSVSMPVGSRFGSTSLNPSSHALQQHHAAVEAAADESPLSPTFCVTSPTALPHAPALPHRSSSALTAGPVLVSVLKERHRRTASPDQHKAAAITITTDDCSGALSPTAAADALSPRSPDQQQSPVSSAILSASFHHASSGPGSSRTLPPLDSLSPSQSSSFHYAHGQSISGGSLSKQARGSNSINALSALHSLRYSLSPINGPLSPSVSSSTPTSASHPTQSPINGSHLHVSVPGDADSVRGKRSSRGVSQWLHSGTQSVTSPSAEQDASEHNGFLSSAAQAVATPSSSPAFPALQGAAALSVTSPIASPMTSPPAVLRSASFYHFKTPKSKKSTDPATFRHPLSSGADKGAMPSLLLPNTRQHIRSASLLRAIMSPKNAQRSLRSPHGRAAGKAEGAAGGQGEEAIAADEDDGDDPISDYHRYICAEAETHKERTRVARMQRLKARRRSSVLPVPVFSAQGELEKSYVQAQHDKRRKLVMKAMTCLPLVHAVFQLPLAAANLPFLYTTCLPITLAAALVLVIHTSLLYRYPSVGSTDRSLDIGLFVTTTLTTLCSVVVLLLGKGESVWWSGTDAPLMYVIFLHLYSMCILRLGFRLCLLQSAVVFAVYTALDCTLSPPPLHSLVFSVSFHLATLVTLLFFAHQRDASQASDVLQQQYLNTERVKADKLLHSMLPARILAEYLDGRVGHVSAVATIGFVIVELGVMQRRRFHSKSSVSEEDPGVWALGTRGSVTGGSPAATSPSVGSISPTEMIKRLHDTFKRIDAVVSMYATRGVCKIETVSKTYMLCSGLLSDTDDHAAAMLDVCLEINNMIVSRQSTGPKLPIALRIGVATGPVVGGIIGRNRKFFRLFGDTVNVSARMSTTAKLGETMMTESTWQALDERQREMYTIDPPRRLLIKGKGEMAVYKLAGAREEWRPTFSKAVMARGHTAQDDRLQTSLMQRHSFVYHNLLLLTKLHPLHLSYRTPDTSIEPCFQHEYAMLMSRDRLKADRGMLVFCLLLMGLSAWQGSWQVMVFLGVAIGLVVVQALLSLSRAYIRHFQPILIGSVFCFLAWVVALEGVTTTESSLSPLLSMQFNIVAISLLTHLQFRFLLPLTCAAFVAFTATLIAVDGATLRIVPPLASLLGTVVASLTAAWLWERRQRRNFLLAYAMEREQQQMDHFLSNLLPKFVLDVLKHKTGTKHASTAQQESQQQSQQPTANPRNQRSSAVAPSVPPTSTPSKQSASPSPSDSPTSASAAHYPQPSPSTQPSTSRSALSTASAPAAPSPRPILGRATVDSAISSRFAMRFARATVFESDIEGYTNLVSSWTAAQVLSVLNRVFSRFDALARRCGVEKIETIGDAFIVVVFDGRSDPVLDFALSVQRAMAELNEENARKASTRETSMVAVNQSQSGVIVADTGKAMGAGEEVNAVRSQETSVVQADTATANQTSAAVAEVVEGAAMAVVPVSEQASSPGPVVAVPDKANDTAPSVDKPKHLTLSPMTSASPSTTSRSFRPPTILPLRLPHTASPSALSSPLTSARPPPFQLHLRMGVSTGPAVGGIVGNEVPRFALFGAALDAAIALEQAGRTDEVTVSRTTYEDAKERYEFELSETMAADGQSTYRLLGKKPKEE